MSTDDVRMLNSRIPDVDLQPVRPDYSQLIRRIRQSGIAFSDRRAVKMQRVIAASALLCGRLHALPSDLWVLRHSWDREDQVDILAALVNEILAGAPADPARDHPESQDAAAVCPETLAAHLDELRRRLETLPAHGAGASALRDSLALLASRSQGVDNSEQRNALQDRIDALWKDLETHPA
jgi:MoxR-like ATPase